MTATEQRTTIVFSHQNEPAAVSCLSSNVGSITDFLFSSTHSTLSTSSNIPSNEIDEQSSNEIHSALLPQILIHTPSDQCININQEQLGNINQTSVRNYYNLKKNCLFFNQGS